jgi:hypothetical protein
MQSILRRLCTDSAHDVPPCGGGVVLGGVVVRYGYGYGAAGGGAEEPVMRHLLQVLLSYQPMAPHMTAT